MAYIVMAYIAMPYTVMAYIVMAYIVMAYIVTAYTVMDLLEEIACLAVLAERRTEQQRDRVERLQVA